MQCREDGYLARAGKDLAEHSDGFAEYCQQFAYGLNLLGHVGGALAMGMEGLTLYQNLAIETPAKVGLAGGKVYVRYDDDDMAMMMMETMLANRPMMQANRWCMDERLAPMFHPLGDVVGCTTVGWFGLTISRFLFCPEQISNCPYISSRGFWYILSRKRDVNKVADWLAAKV
ncbi:hypothetical protein BDV93DRAFT_98935 [Ceratobasidium sp. AG-I]|nr:hypothetical protein BDV93DRAFT_98935 [Ceratobasidium sp. AG-I]